MIDRDDDVARRYRGLPREQPPLAIDAAILAASRRAVGARPSGLRRWAAPLSAAAILVLSVGVVMRMQVEEPGIETSVAPPAEPVRMPEPQPEAKVEAAAAPSTPASSPAPAPQPKRMKAAKPAPSEQASEPRQDSVAREASAPVAPPAKTTIAAASAPPPAPAARDAAPEARAELRMAPQAALARETPEAILERIAKLRADGRDEEADRALEQFRRDHPDYRMSDAQLERVRRRER